MTIGTTFRRRTLYFDAATCAAMGAGLVFGADPLGHLFDLPTVLLQASGFLLLLFAALLFWTARQSRPQPVVVWGIIAANLVWALASAVVLLGEFVAPNALGIVFVAGQAVAVTVIADMEAMALRRAKAAIA